MACAACGDEHSPGTATCPRTGTSVTDGPCGTVIDSYLVERWIGGGGAGAVYRARHRMIQQPVALKLLRRGLEHDAETVARFRREAQAAAAIGHRRIPRVIDLGVTPEGRPFLVMDLLEGRDLRTLFAAEAPLAAERAIELAIQILEGLEAAHRAGIVHRDIKPANVFVGHDADGRESVCLLDFGLSRMMEPSLTGALTAAGTVIGTPHYMAPEQATGATDVDERADLYATAVILFQALSGALPFPGDTVETLLVRIASGPPVPLAQVAPGAPPMLVAVVERGMAREPAARWPSARAFAEALREVRGHLGAPAPATTAPSPTPAVITSKSWPAPAPSPIVGPPAVEASPPTSWPVPPPSPAPSPPRAASSTRLFVLVAVIAVALLAGIGVVVAVVGLRAEPATALRTIGPGPSVASPADLSAAENSPDAVRSALATWPVPAAPTPEGGPKQGVSFGMPVLEGPLPEPALRSLLVGARTSMEVCRPRASPARVRLRFSVDPAGQMTRVPFAANEADVVVSSCVASRLEGQRLPAAGTTGAFRVEVALAPR